jgi:hypothetical protein
MGAQRGARRAARRAHEHGADSIELLLPATRRARDPGMALDRVASLARGGA